MLRREHGQVIPLLAVGLLAFLLGVSALVVDVGHAYLVKRQLQASADAAALAAANSLPDSAAAADTAAAYGAAGKNRVDGADVNQSVRPYCLRTLAYCYGNTAGLAPANGRGNGIVVKESASVPTHFAKLFGIDSISVKARATACGLCSSRPHDIVLVVDRTGSMSGNMDDLQNGVRTFLQLLDPQLDYVGLVLLPPLRTPSACSSMPFETIYPFSAWFAYPQADEGYVADDLTNDYQRTNGWDNPVFGTLNPSSKLVRDVDCLKSGGTTAYKQALLAAQQELRDHGRPNVGDAIIFESDGAANTAPESYYDQSLPSTSYDGDRLYSAAAGHEDDVRRPCGSAVDAASAIKSSRVAIYTLAFAVRQDETCYQAPHLEGDATVGYREIPEGLDAGEALRQIASPGDAVSQASEGDMSAAFARVANKLLASRLVPEAEAP